MHASIEIHIEFLFFWFELQVMDLVVKENFVLEERRISLSEFHTADEVVFFSPDAVYSDQCVQIS